MIPQRNNRVLRELRELDESEEVEFIILDNDEYINVAHRIKFISPRISPYEGVKLTLQICFPPRYPFEPPDVSFTSPIYHPNIDGSGRICLDLLKMPPKGTWRPTITIISLLNAIKVLLVEPSPDDPLMPEIARQYINDRDEYLKRAHDHLIRNVGGGDGEEENVNKEIGKDEPVNVSGGSRMSLKRKRSS